MAFQSSGFRMGNSLKTVLSWGNYSRTECFFFGRFKACKTAERGFKYIFVRRKFAWQDSRDSHNLGLTTDF